MKREIMSRLVTIKYLPSSIKLKLTHAFHLINNPNQIMSLLSIKMHTIQHKLKLPLLDLIRNTKFILI